MQIKVFVSYSGNDELKAERLVEELRTYNIDVWIDKEMLVPGDDLKPNIKEGIETSHTFLSCLSKNYINNFKGSWVEKELAIAVKNEKATKFRKIIPVRFERAKGNKLPSILGKRAFADLSDEKKWQYNFPRLLESIKKIVKNNKSE